MTTLTPEKTDNLEDLWADDRVPVCNIRSRPGKREENCGRPAAWRVRKACGCNPAQMFSCRECKIFTEHLAAMSDARGRVRCTRCWTITTLTWIPL
jgi:hypothetical protein